MQSLDTRIVEFRDGDYEFRGTRAPVGTFDVVAIDVNHPNYGYFAEYMAFWRSPHVPDWQPVVVNRGLCDIKTPQDIVSKFPLLSILFTEEEQ